MNFLDDPIWKYFTVPLSTTSNDYTLEFAACKECGELCRFRPNPASNASRRQPNCLTKHLWTKHRRSHSLLFRLLKKIGPSPNANQPGANGPNGPSRTNEARMSANQKQSPSKHGAHSMKYLLFN